MDVGSIRMTMQLESKKIDGHRRVVIPAPGAADAAAGETLPPFFFRGLYLTAKMVYYKCEVFYE